MGMVLGGCVSNPPWHLDRVSNNRTSNVFRFDEPQPATIVYVLDTLIDVKHNVFKPDRARHGLKLHPQDTSYTNGHGTHVAGLIATINKQAKIVGVQVLDNTGWGSWSIVIKGLEWVAKHKPSIINISMAGTASPLLDAVLKRLTSLGWKIVVAAGNTAVDACKVSPARSKYVVTVGATNESNHRASFSNYGSCVNIYAPGTNILSSYPNNLYAYMSGTSMSSPIVAGVWSIYPNKTIKQILTQHVLGQVINLFPSVHC